MALVDHARRWVKDRMTQDENINGKPRDKIRNLSDAVHHMTPTERKRNLEHVNAYVEYYYQGHHKEAVPHEVRNELRSLNRQVERLNTVDQAREVLQKYGGPPTKETVADSLERSVRERAKEPVKTASRQQQKGVTHEPSLEV